MLEVIIALAVIAIALLSAMGLMLHSGNLQQVTEERSVAQEIAATEIERLKNYPAAGRFDELATLDGTTEPVDELNNGQMLRSVNTDNPNLYNVQITITWTAGGLNQSYTDFAMIAR